MLIWQLALLSVFVHGSAFALTLFAMSHDSLRIKALGRRVYRLLLTR